MLKSYLEILPFCVDTVSQDEANAQSKHTVHKAVGIVKWWIVKHFQFSVQSWKKSVLFPQSRKLITLCQITAFQLSGRGGGSVDLYGKKSVQNFPLCVVRVYAFICASQYASTQHVVHYDVPYHCRWCAYRAHYVLFLLCTTAMLHNFEFQASNNDQTLFLRR